MTRHTRVLLAIGGSALTALLAGCSGGEDIQSELGQGWELVWNDEFDGDQIDSSKWSHETNCWGGGNNELQCYTDRAENSFVRDGKLVIHALEEEFTGPSVPIDWAEYDPANDVTLPYTSARLRSLDKGDFDYGRIEVRAKVPGGQGLWPAIWMLPTDWEYGDWAASGEIDIMEAVNLGTSDELAVHGTLHYGAVWPNNTSSGTKYVFWDSDPRAQFHTYAIEWAEGEIRWYVDDVHYATQRQTGWFSQVADADGSRQNLTNGEPFDKRFHLLLNVAIGGAWPGNPDDSTELPVEMEIDFVRVFTCTEDPATLAACATVSPGAAILAGNQPAEVIDVDYDPAFMDGDTVTIVAGEVVGPYLTGTWASSGTVEMAMVEDSERGPVVEITYATDESVAYFQSNDGFDFSAFDRIEFDLLVVEDPRTEPGLFIKMDCFHPCGTGDYPIDAPPVGVWTSYSIPLADLVSFDGSTLDLATVNTPLVVLPTWGNQNGVVLRLDNVRIER
ncbi:MAG: beta-glucanase [Actinobacteria bacterium HGW-Actinobacteria-4]|nr:MAG: beta-glucanase [Actinobacteria bacterium HGW-Actinobacteria-4]